MYISPLFLDYLELLDFLHRQYLFLDNRLGVCFDERSSGCGGHELNEEPLIALFLYLGAPF